MNLIIDIGNTTTKLTVFTTSIINIIFTLALIVELIDI